ITELEADVVLLQEIENQTCIDALLARLPEFSDGYIGEQGYAASLDTAVLVGLPTLALISHQDDEFPRLDGSGLTSFTRDLLEVHVDVDGARVIVFAAHFRSKVDDDPGRRLAEGQRAGEWLAMRAAEYPEATIVLGGDLNDVPASPPLQALESSGPLLRVASELADDSTYLYDGKASALDHLFQALSAAGAAVPGSAKIFRSPTAWDGGGWGGSDHAALRASFTVGG
ncbi:MAG: endonuclease/exonuclease/phosphatase family protein, partial [Myxococcales bacterium]|nr:endonuclease/exonuclease/phosphatase family protein [Myxococcales bacterium]